MGRIKCAITCSKEVEVRAMRDLEMLNGHFAECFTPDDVDQMCDNIRCGKPLLCGTRIVIALRYAEMKLEEHCGMREILENAKDRFIKDLLKRTATDLRDGAAEMRIPYLRRNDYRLILAALYKEGVEMRNMINSIKDKTCNGHDLTPREMNYLVDRMEEF